MPSNLNTFNDPVQSGMSPEEAAASTFTGKMAARFGFTDVSITSLSGEPGAYTDAQALFTRSAGSGMEALVRRIGAMVDSGSTLADVLGVLRESEPFKLTPFNFMRMMEASGFRMPESREIVALFDPEFRPLVAPAEIEEQWKLLIRSRRHP
jgi:hypothetical protein